MKNLGLVPLRNFGIVDESLGLYRSAQPMYNYEYAWMRKNLGIKTIVNLRSESKHDDNLGRGQGFKVIDFLVPDHKSPTKEQINDFMNIIKDSSNFPLLFHCEHGQGRTSTFCIASRIAMGWTLKEALDEENNVFKYTFKHKEQIDFLNETFK
jgi:tyrosine-protein phosphatase SIW14